MHDEEYEDQAETTYILAAEWVGIAEVVDGILDVGGIKIDYPNRADVYVRRSSKDLSIMEIHIARHDGLAVEWLEHQNEEAEHDPQGPKEYWRREMVGKYTYGPDEHLMTDEEFEATWTDEQ